MKIFEIINKNIRSTLKLYYHKEPEEKHGPIITISREKGAAGTQIAEVLAKKLGKKWDYYHKDIIEKIARKSNVSVNKIEEVDEKEISFLEDFFAGLIGKDYYSLNNYYRDLLKVLAEIGDQGHVIIVGRGANFLFKNALKIRIIADLEFRVNWLMENKHLSKKEAMNIINKTDKERKLLVYNLFNKDIDNPEYYDLVIKNSPELDIDEITDLIAFVAGKRFKL